MKSIIYQHTYFALRKYLGIRLVTTNKQFE